jgi:hypothetical protein
MTALAKQVVMGGLDLDADEEAEIEAGYVWREQLWSALRTFVAGYVDIETGLKRYEGCAYRLNKRWATKGRPVTPDALQAALRDSERNNLRAEWLDWFAARDAELANLIAHRVRPTKSKDEVIADLEKQILEEYPKHGAGTIRRARAR